METMKEFYLSIEGDRILRIGGRSKAGDVKEHFLRLDNLIYKNGAS